MTVVRVLSLLLLAAPLSACGAGSSDGATPDTSVGATEAPVTATTLTSLPSTSARVPGPYVVWAPPAVDEASPHSTGMAAEVRGTVRYDDEHGCFLLDDPGFASGVPVVWPAGTVAASDAPGVVLADGRVVHEGDSVDGGGGYLHVADEWNIPDACADASNGEIAVFNSGDRPGITPG